MKRTVNLHHIATKNALLKIPKFDPKDDHVRLERLPKSASLRKKLFGVLIAYSMETDFRNKRNIKGVYVSHHDIMRRAIERIQKVYRGRS